MTETKRVSDAALNLILRGCQIEVHVVGGALEALSLDLRDERAANEALRLAHAKAMAVVEAAQGLAYGTDWNKGNHAIKHGYRKKLLDALTAYFAPVTEEKA